MGGSASRRGSPNGYHHTSVTDRLGNRPGFKNSVHGNLARGLNARFGRFDSVWSGCGSCDTVAPTDDESLEDLAYTDCNPVTSGHLPPPTMSSSTSSCSAARRFSVPSRLSTRRPTAASWVSRSWPRPSGGAAPSLGRTASRPCPPSPPRRRADGSLSFGVTPRGAGGSGDLPSGCSPRPRRSVNQEDSPVSGCLAAATAKPSPAAKNICPSTL